MLLNLEIENSYAHTKAKFEFKKGLTTITGLNGSGKSEILEIIQWLLFGTKALRGESKAKARLEFEVKGQFYSVTRHKNTAVLRDQKENSLASGIKAVNSRILSILGYSYEVFTIANCVNQGKIDELGEMLPTQRKRLVDATIGLDRLDDITKWITAEISSLNGEIRGHEKYLIEPTFDKIDPAPDQSPEALRESWGEALVRNTERNTLLERANAVLFAVDLEPDVAKLPELEEAQERRSQALGAIKALETVVAPLPRADSLKLPKLHPLAGDLAALEAETQEFHFVKRERTKLTFQREDIAVPVYSAEELEAAEKQWDIWDKIEARNTIRANRVEIHCPKCFYVFSKEDDRLKTYEGLPEEVETPILSKKTLQKQKLLLPKIEEYNDLSRKIDTLSAQLENLTDHTDTIKAIKEAQQDVDQFVALQSQASYRETLEAQIRDLYKVLPPDQSKKIDHLKYNRSKHAEYLQLLAIKTEAQEKLKAYSDDLPEVVSKLSELFEAKKQYVIEWTGYQTAMEIYKSHKDEVDRLNTERTDWDNARKAIATMREHVKTFLIPSLNRTASILISQFSSGWLTNVKVDEEFNIDINGQPISTLSGAGKAFANLALRVGLGLVLTNGVFSTLMLDEIDAGVDKEKAPALAKALRSLTNQIQQVIYVSHKSNLESDHAISL